MQSRFHVHAVKARLGAKDARRAGEVGVHIGRFFALGQCCGACLEDLSQPRKHIAEQARDAQRHVNARTVQQGQWQYLKARNALAAFVPFRRKTGEMHGHSDLFARRAHGGRPPKINHQPARPVAVVLQMPPEQFFDQFHALRMGGPAGHAARIDGIEVAPRGQHIRAPAIGGAGRTSSDAPPRKRGQQPVPFALPRAKDVEAIAVLAFLDVADEGVNSGQRLGRGTGSIEAKVIFDPRRLRLGADRVDQPVAARGVEPIGGGIFIQQPFQTQQPFGRFAVFQRGWKMAQGHRADAPLGLCRFARIIDDERIDHRQIAGQRLGPAVVRQSHSLARQPFQRAMRADVHQRVVPLCAQPEVEGHIGMTRGASEVVIAVFAVLQIAAFRLQRDQRVAAGLRGEVERAILNQRIILNRAPCVAKVIAQRLWQAGQGGVVVGKRPRNALFGQAPAKTDLRRDAIALARQPHQHVFDAGQRIKADRVGQLIVPPRIGREHQRQFAPVRRSLRKPLPAQHALYDRCDAGIFGAVGKAGILQIGVAFFWAFEADNAGENTAIHLGQDHMHGQIGGGKAALAFVPITPPRGRKRHLENRASRRVERGAAVIPAPRKGGGVDD